MILCADDFGLNSPVSKGILNLVQAGKINSVSCLVTTDCWKKMASELCPFVKDIEVGLHLTLTHPNPVHFSNSSLGALVIKSYLGILKKEDVVQEIRQQIELFTSCFGRSPNYIDGHEFCHHLPIIREALTEVVEEFCVEDNGFYVRIFCPGSISFLKNSFVWIVSHLTALPSQKLKTLLKLKSIPFNFQLLGFHPYQWEPKKYFDYYFQIKPSPRDIFFCHPGLASDDQLDSLRNYRYRIYNFMMSPQFEDMLKHYQITRDSKLVFPASLDDS